MVSKTFSQETMPKSFKGYLIHFFNEIAQPVPSISEEAHPSQGQVNILFVFLILLSGLLK